MKKEGSDLEFKWTSLSKTFGKLMSLLDKKSGTSKTEDTLLAAHSKRVSVPNETLTLPESGSSLSETSFDVLFPVGQVNRDQVVFIEDQPFIKMELSDAADVKRDHDAIAAIIDIKFDQQEKEAIIDLKEKDDSLTFKTPETRVLTPEEPEALPSSWDFMAEFDLGDEADDVPETADNIVTNILSEETIVDNINANMLKNVIDGAEDLVEEIDDLLGVVSTGQTEKIKELLRKVHTLKGDIGQAGALRVRALIHHMETIMEEVQDGRFKIEDKKPELYVFFDQAKKLIKDLRDGKWSSSDTGQGPDKPEAVQAPKFVKVHAHEIDKMIGDVNETRLAAVAIEEFIISNKNKLKDLEENAMRASVMLRELELQSEIQIQSRRTRLQEAGDEFDPLEFDQFTRLQELSRLASETIFDIFEVRRDLTRFVSEQETLVAHQKRTILSAQDILHKTRLTQVDAINDRLHNVVWQSSREEGKSITFEMTGGRVELDRVLLEKIIPPLEHILRNSVVHGIEKIEDRKKLGKAPMGVISAMFKQEAGRVLIEIADDGYGLRVDKIKEKAVEKGLWNAKDSMDDFHAAEMICAPGFSTAEAVSSLAGRGVGMDVVRNNILALGGKFELRSVEKEGLRILIQLPTSIASASVLVAESGGESWAFPVEMVEHVILMTGQDLVDARLNKVFSSKDGLEKWAGAPFRLLEDLTGVRSHSINGDTSAPILLLKERGQTMALEVSKLVQVFEVPLQPAGPLWNGVKGVAGTVILPNSDSIFLVDPFGFALTKSSSKAISETTSPQKSSPLVMVVDDSLTVRKATVRFLQKNGFDIITAKDGQEALDILLKVQPDLILMDIEMPRMDGFDCTKNIRENPRHAHIPIVMITSRTAEKHRQRATMLGANEYLGKPFKEEELLHILGVYTGKRK